MSGHGAVYFDGRTARRRVVALWLAPDALEIAEGGETLARWPYGGVRQGDGAADVLRLSSDEPGSLARLEVRDPLLAGEIRARCPHLDRPRPGRDHRAWPIVAWSLAAAASLVLTSVYLVPLAADRLAPLVPHALERRLGDAVDNQVKTLMGGKVCAGREGAAALERLTARLLAAAPAPVPVEVAVLDSRIPNAAALPGGRIYLFRGLLSRAETPDEVAGVLAHEIGHAANRDGLRKLIQASGSSFLLGLLFGDVVGAGVILTAGRAVIDSAYSREQESAADRYAADLMLALGRSPTPLGAFLLRMTGAQRERTLGLLASHPMSEDRLGYLAGRDRPATGDALLNEEEWRALKSICN